MSARSGNLLDCRAPPRPSPRAGSGSGSAVPSATPSRALRGGGVWTPSAAHRRASYNPRHGGGGGEARIKHLEGGGRGGAGRGKFECGPLTVKGREVDRYRGNAPRRPLSGDCAKHFTTFNDNFNDLTMPARTILPTKVGSHCHRHDIL